VGSTRSNAKRVTEMKCTCGGELEPLPLRNDEYTDDRYFRCKKCQSIEVQIKRKEENVEQNRTHPVER
jgi:Zn finger protein HypA/HybF involved in hydrogenase expression